MDIAKIIGLAVMAKRIPRELRHRWRESYNNIAVYLRHAMVADGKDYFDEAQVSAYVENWVAEQREKKP